MPASVVLHVVVITILIFGPTIARPPAEEDEAIPVDLVPPPEEKQPPPSNNAASQAPPPVLNPAFQFGEKDAGPKVSPEGNSATEGSTSPAAAQVPDKQDFVQPPAMATNEAPQATAPETQEPSPPMPDAAVRAQKTVRLHNAKILFSRSATMAAEATIAMSNVPRGVRVARLCTTELREQLLHASPPYLPEILPYDELKEGTVLDKPDAAFRADWQWRDVSYRCEVNADATKIVSFAFHVGDPIPQSEWARRGLPVE